MNRYVGRHAELDSVEGNFLCPPVTCTTHRWIQVGKVTYPAALRGLDGLSASCQVLVPFVLLLFCINWKCPLLFPAPTYLYESFEIRNQYEVMRP